MDNNVNVIVSRTPCKKHTALIGAPCWVVYQFSGAKSDAVCNKRAKAAGFNGRIHPSSLRKK